MNSTATRLLVITDADAAQALCAGLAAFGFAPQSASDPAEVEAQLAAQRYDLVVLDLMLRSVSALSLTRALRQDHALPVILISDPGSAVDRVVGLEMGADDCMDRPLVLRELTARIRTVLRRSAAPERMDCIRFDGWELRRAERDLRSPAGRAVALSNAEYRLLAAFLQAPRRVVSRDDLASQTRGVELAANSRCIDLLVSRLRRKLHAQADRAPPIRSVRGLGYVFDARSVESAA